MNVTIIGTGYVGLVTGCCFAEMGNQVTCVDIDEDKVKRLKKGDPIIHENGLEELLKNNLKSGRIKFKTTLKSAMLDASVIFLAVGTPSKEDGSADLTAIEAVAKEIGQHICRTDYIIITKSTVPVGTGDLIEGIISGELDERNSPWQFDVVSNPEFLKEGNAVEDFMKPDRIILGYNEDTELNTIPTLHELYKPFNRNHNKLLIMKRRDAEMTKYAANAMLATKISFMNEMATLCDDYEVDIENVRLGIGSDERIGYSFIYPGVGYGGSCFPKDVRAAIHMGNEKGRAMGVLSSVEMINNFQKVYYLYNKYRNNYGEIVEDKKYAVWGLAFKPGTDDLREAPSYELIKRIIDDGGNVIAHDPIAGPNALKEFPKEWFDSGALKIVEDQYNVLDSVEALFVVTEWKSYRRPDLSQLMTRMANVRIVDGRNIYDPDEMKRNGIEYIGVGR